MGGGETEKYTGIDFNEIYSNIKSYSGGGVTEICLIYLLMRATAAQQYPPYFLVLYLLL